MCSGTNSPKNDRGGTFFEKFIGLKSLTLLQKDSATGVSVKFPKFFKTFRKVSYFTEHHWTVASGIIK